MIQMLISTFSKYPQFWDELEKELSEHSNDLDQVKSVLTILGYMTKSSIVSIKTLKKVENLECEYTKMRSIKLEEMNSRFPTLKFIDSFTPGMKTIIMDVASNLNKKPKELMGHADLDAMKAKVCVMAKKVFIIHDLILFEF